MPPALYRSRLPSVLRLFLALVANVLAALNCHAQSSLSSAQRSTLRDSTRFALLAESDRLPPAIIALCADADGRLAFQRERWTLGDVRIGNWPRRRVIWAARNKELFVVHLEQGGFAHTHYIIVAETQQIQSDYRLLWQAVGPRLRDYQDFVEAMKSDDFQSEPASHRR
jgi:hypothetical protein